MTTTLLDEIGEDRRMLLEAAELITSSRGMNQETFRRRMHVGFVKAARLLILLDQCAIAAPSESARWVALVSADDLPAHLARLGLPLSCGAVSPHGDVCVRLSEHDGMCDSGVGRKRVSSPGQAGKPWRWYRDAAAAPTSAPTSAPAPVGAPATPPVPR